MQQSGDTSTRTWWVIGLAAATLIVLGAVYTLGRKVPTLPEAAEGGAAQPSDQDQQDATQQPAAPEPLTVEPEPVLPGLPELGLAALFGVSPTFDPVLVGLGRSGDSAAAYVPEEALYVLGNSDVVAQSGGIVYRPEGFVVLPPTGRRETRTVDENGAVTESASMTPPADIFERSWKDICSDPEMRCGSYYDLAGAVLLEDMTDADWKQVEPDSLPASRRTD